MELTNNIIFDFLSKNLTIEIEDVSTPDMFGGECKGFLGVKVSLLLTNPKTNEQVVISTDKCNLG